MAALHYAVMIEADGTDTAPTLGLYSGCFCWVTGRPGFDGTAILTSPPTNPKTAAAQEVWREGILIKDGLGSPAYSVDLQDLGTYGTVSDLDIQVKNTEGFSFYLNNDQVWLYRRKVQFFVIVDNTFYLWWTGVVDSITFNERVLKIKAVDVYKEIHKDFPPQVLDKAKFPNAKSSLYGKPIPVCIGKVAHAKLINVYEMGDREAAYQASGVDYYETVATVVQSDKITIDLMTGTLAISANAWKGKYLVCVRSGPKQEVRIASNLASSAGLTRVVLEGRFLNGKTAYTILVWPGASNVPLGVWYFGIANREQPRIVSDGPIFQFESASSGTGGIVQEFDSESEEYLDISPVLSSSSTTNIGSTGFPGIATSAGKRIDEGGSVQEAWGFIKPQTAIRRTHSEGATVSGHLATLSASSTWPTGDGTSLPNLIDQVRATRYDIIADRVQFHSGDMVLRAAFEIAIPEQVYRNWEGGVGLYVDFETQYTGNVVPTPFAFDINIMGKDVFGGITEVANANPPVSATPADSTYNASGSRTHYYIYPKYYGLPDAGSVERQSWISLDRLFKDWKSLRAYGSLVVEFKCTVGANAQNHSFRFSVNEVAIQTLKKVDVITGDLMTKVQGATYGTTWGGRRTASAAVDGVLDAAELLFRNYDGAGAYVDTASWDAAASFRDPADFAVGRQVMERKNSIDYLIELCKHGQFCITPRPNGARALIPWTVTLSGGPVLDDSAWVAGSLSEIVDTPLHLCWNEFEFKYDYDAGLGKCKRVFFLKNVDQASFPLEATLRTGTSIPEWQFWVGGCPDYVKAASTWLVARDGYLLSKTRNTLRLELPWFISNEDWGGSASDDGPVNLCREMLDWVYIPKQTFSAKLPITSSSLGYTLAQIFQFTCAPLGISGRRAYFSGLRLNTQSDVIEVSAIAQVWTFA